MIRLAAQLALLAVVVVFYLALAAIALLGNTGRHGSDRLKDNKSVTQSQEYHV